jgi:hypothetical protein
MTTGRRGDTPRAPTTGPRPTWGGTLGSRPDRLADCFNEFVFVGKRARLELGIELRAAHCKLETASSGGNHDEMTDGALVTS